MRILMVHRPGGAFGYISDSMAAALRDKGHTVMRWDGNETTWHQFRPDIYIGAGGHKQPIPSKRADCKVALHVNPYGPVNIKDINENADSIKWVLEQKPDATFGYGHENDRILWSYWTTKHGIPWVPIPTAGDKLQFKQITPYDQRPYDVIYLGGRWAYKGKTIDKYLLPVLKHPDIKSKLYGWGEWPPNTTNGVLPEDQVNQFLNSGLIGPCISEQHTHDFGIDIPERVFKLALCGTLAIHDAVPAIKTMIPSMIVAQTPEIYLDYCLHFSKPGAAEERAALAQKQREEVLAAHTYHHRLTGLFSALGFTSEAAEMAR